MSRSDAGSNAGLAQGIRDEWPQSNRVTGERQIGMRAFNRKVPGGSSDECAVPIPRQLDAGVNLVRDPASFVDRPDDAGIMS